MNRTVYKYQDSNPITISNYTSANSSGPTTYRPSITFYNFACAVEATCAAPVVGVTNVGSHSADVVWAPGADETSWELSYKPASSNSWIPVNTVTGSDYALTGLMAATNYDVLLMHECQGDTFTSVAHFITGCDLIDSVPYFQDFNSLPANNTEVHAPVCWYGHSSYDEYYPYPDNYYNCSGSGSSMYMYHDTYNNPNNYTMIQLPQVDTSVLPINTLQVEFALLRSYSYTMGIVVGVCPGVGMDGFVPVDTVVCEGLNTWEFFDVPLTSYSDSGSYITLVAYSGTDSYCYPYLDDVRLVLAPDCLRPDAIFATTITTTSATVQWTLRDTTQTDFEVRYGRQGCDVDTLTSILVSGADTLLITGLDSGVYYDVYVRANCGSSNSPWTMGTFRTLVSAPVTTLPYFCDFSGTEGQNWTLANGSETNKWYLGQAVYQGTADSMAIYISSDNGATHSYNTGSVSTVWAYRTITFPAGDYVYSYDWMAQGESEYYDFLRAFLVPVSEMLDGGINPAGSPYDMGYWVAPSTWIDLTNDNTTPYSLNQSSTWTNNFGTFTLPTAGTYNLAFVWTNDGSGGTNPPAAVDNVQISPNTCPYPENFHVSANTSSSVTVDWTGSTDASGYDLCINTTGAAPTADTSVTSGPVTFGGLTPGTRYYIYIRTQCDYGTDSSMWIGPVSAIPGVVNMTANATDTFYMCGGVIYSSGGATGTYQNYETTTAILMPDAPNNLVSVQGSWLGESCCDYFYIYDGIGTSGTQLATGYGSNITIPLCLSTTGPLTINYTSDVSSCYRGLELFVSCVSTSCRIFNVRQNPAYTLSDDRLDIIWDTNGADIYQVEYGNAGFAQGTGTMLTTYNNYITLTGLTGLTNYDVYVRSICDGGADTGTWAIATFQTAMCASATELYSYDSTMSTTTSSYGPMGYSFYNYGYVQTLIDSAQMAGLTDPINAFAFSPSSTSQGSYYTHCDIYMANVPETSLSSGFIMPDTTNHRFVEVIHDGDMCYTSTGWQLHGFDTTFTWDGHSNVLFVVNRRHGSYSSGAGDELDVADV